jgi:acyl carrier protein
MLSQHEILDGVRQVLSTHLEINGPVELDTDVQRDLCLSSIQRLTLIVELENHFRVCFAPGDEHGLSSLGDVVALIHRRLGASHDSAA